MEHCSIEYGKRIADELQKTISKFHFTWEGKSFKLGVSIGIATVTAVSENLTEVLHHVDTACYAAKDAGGNRIQIYREDNIRLTERYGEMRWVTRIHDALEEDRLHLYYQTIQALAAQKTDGLSYELLLRMEGEEDEIILPDAFLPAAERYNLANKVDRWVVRRALDWLASHPQQLEATEHCAINLSGQSLANIEFLDFIGRRFDETAVPSSKILFEVTETAAITHLSNAMRFFRTLRERGCKFALDDFGSGMSSFAYLKNLPVDFLKIDGAFVKDIVDDPIDFAMVKSINEIGRVMQKQTIAEFVENKTILKKLQELNIGYVQGYAIARPRPLDEMPVNGNVELLKRNDVHFA